jgi:hypothetical protein
MEAIGVKLQLTSLAKHLFKLIDVIQETFENDTPIFGIKAIDARTTNSIEKLNGHCSSFGFSNHSIDKIILNLIINICFFDLSDLLLEVFFVTASSALWYFLHSICVCIFLSL